MNYISTKVKALVSSISLVAATAVIGTAMVSAAPAVVFNNGSGVAGVGEEKNFLRINDVNGPDTTEACTDGQNVKLWFYVHNTNPTELNGPNNDGIGVAKNTKVDIDFKNDGYVNSNEIEAKVKADNSALAVDNVFITCQGKKIKVSYVSQSLVTNAPAFTSPYALTGSIMDNATLGYDGGVVPGCFDFRAYITVTVKVNVEEVVTPMYTCDIVTPTKISDNKYSFKVNYTAKNGATFKDVTYVYSDGNTVTDGDSNTHTFTKTTGKQVTVTVNFNIPGQTETVSSPGNENCVIKIGNTTVVTTPPTTLPKTGAGSTIAIFGVTSVLGALLYRMRALRNAR